MGYTARDKHIRTSRRTRSVKPDIDDIVIEPGIKPLDYQMGVNEISQNPNPNPNANPNPNFDDNGCSYCTEEQLEELLLKNLEFLYNEAISKLVGLGYDEDVSLKAILKNGHCYGGMDALTNILHNSLAHLNSGCGNTSGNSEESDPTFFDLRQLEEYSLAAMVCLLQQVKPHLTKGDAMWCLLMSDLHVGRASMMEIPVLPLASNNGSCNTVPNTVESNTVESVGSNPVGVAPALCRYHGGWDFGNGGISEFPLNGFLSNASEMTLQRDIECPKRFNLTPSMMSLLKRNVALFAAGFRANSKKLQTQSQALTSSPAAVSGNESSCEQNEALPNSKNQDAVNYMLSKFRELKLDENMEYVPEDQKDEIILSLIHQIKDLQKQVKERKEWAHQKAMQAARKLSNDLMELKMLRMEREETQCLKKGKQTLEDPTMKRLTEIENALRKASGQVDRANAAVRRLDTENAEIRAEMEASKLSASESVTTCLEVAKREKKCLKRLLAWEKQKTKLQEEITAEKQKISELQQQLVQLEAAQKEAEVKWRQEQNAKELALSQVDEERRLKETTEADNKRKHETLRLKIEIDFQRHRDDLQRLEQDLSHLKAASKSNHQNHQTNSVSIGEESIASWMLRDLDDSSDKDAAGYHRECLICRKHEVSVVFLPCAHQVMCGNCNDDYAKKGKVICPCCRVPIEQRIRVFGATSN